MANGSALSVDDVVVSKSPDGHVLLIVTADPADRLSLVFRGNAWTVQYAVARGAKLASGKGGNLWYTSDETTTLEYLETFRGDPRQSQALRKYPPSSTSPVTGTLKRMDSDQG
jgi:hypothetical protein